MTPRSAASPPGPDPASGPDPDTALKLWVVLARAHQAIYARAAADIARYGLTLTEFGILEALHHKGPMLLGEVQRKLLVSSGGITYLVDRLVQQGLVERQPCPGDRRARYAVLTPKGQAFIQQTFPRHAQWIAQTVAGLDQTEQRDAAHLLRRLGRFAADLPD